MRAVSMILVCGKRCFLVKAVIRCSIKISGCRCVYLGSVTFVRDAGKKKNMIGA
jgi:hypothetical protein